MVPQRGACLVASEGSSRRGDHGYNRRAASWSRCYGEMVTFEIAASYVSSQPTRSTARTATRCEVKNALVSVTTSVPCRSATTMRFVGSAQMMLSPMLGEVWVDSRHLEPRRSVFHG